MNMDIDKLIELFGLNRNFTKAELEQAYRDLVQVWHPDKYSYNPRLQHKAEEKLKEINNAYELLKELLANSNTDSEGKVTSQRSEMLLNIAGLIIMMSNYKKLIRKVLNIHIDQDHQ